MRCDACRILALDLVNGDLSVEEELVVQEHLDTCQQCRSHYEGCLSEHEQEARSHEVEADADLAARYRTVQKRSSGWFTPALIAAAILVVALLGLRLIAQRKGSRLLGGWRHACTPALHGVRH